MFLTRHLLGEFLQCQQRNLATTTRSATHLSRMLCRTQLYTIESPISNTDWLLVSQSSQRQNVNSPTNNTIHSPFFTHTRITRNSPDPLHDSYTPFDPFLLITKSIANVSTSVNTFSTTNFVRKYHGTTYSQGYSACDRQFEA